MPVKIYAKVGESAQQFNGIKPNDWIEMQSERPERSWIAQANGTWKEVPNAARIAEIDVELAALESKLIRPMSNLLDGKNEIVNGISDRQKYDELKSQITILQTERAGLI